VSDLQADSRLLDVGQGARGGAAPVPPPVDPAESLREIARSQVNRYALAVVVVGGLLLTFLFAFISVSSDNATRNERFNAVALDANSTVQGRLDEYVEVLVGLRGLFAAGAEAGDDAEVTRAQFDAYIDSTDVLHRFPGALALGFGQRVAARDIDALEEQLQDEGFDDFAVTPAIDADADEAFPVVYLQPMEGSGGAFGFDLGADPNVRATLEAAATGGEEVFGGPLLVSAAEGADRRASNLYLPVYAGGAVPAEPAERASELSGAAFILFSAQDAFIDLFSGEAEAKVEIYDLGAVGGPPGIEPTTRNLLFDSDGDPQASAARGLDQGNETTVAGRRWLVYVQPGPAFDAPAGSFPWLAVVAGLLITGLLAALMVSFSQTRAQAVALADEMTASLRARENELRNANEGIVRSNRELERYASIAAHDLQEPLRSLLAYASVLERRYGDDLDPEALDQVQRMARAAERMRSLVVDLLSYAKADSQQRKVEMVDLNEAIRVAIDDLSVLIHETRATIRVADLPRVPGNRRELIGVFSNLLSNALKYRSEEPPAVVVVAHEREEEWVIGVKDNGIGVAPAYHDRIFELFRRLEKRSTDSGTGLGLAICARTIAQHGGRIWVESEEGQGATFWFTLPKEPHGVDANDGPWA
jgi:signal transduction histidine kinase